MRLMARPDLTISSRLAGGELASSKSAIQAEAPGAHFASLLLPSRAFQKARLDRSFGGLPALAKQQQEPGLFFLIDQML